MKVDFTEMRMRRGIFLLPNLLTTCCLFGGFYAIVTICTHLGCTPNFLAAENKFKCPCHGSGFRTSGVNFEGPAPRPLQRARIVLAERTVRAVAKNGNRAEQRAAAYQRRGHHDA